MGCRENEIGVACCIGVLGTGLRWRQRSVPTQLDPKIHMPSSGSSGPAPQPPAGRAASSDAAGGSQARGSQGPGGGRREVRYSFIHLKHVFLVCFIAYLLRLLPGILKPAGFLPGLVWFVLGCVFTLISTLLVLVGAAWAACTHLHPRGSAARAPARPLCQLELCPACTRACMGYPPPSPVRRMQLALWNSLTMKEEDPEKVRERQERTMQKALRQNQARLSKLNKKAQKQMELIQKQTWSGPPKQQPAIYLLHTYEGAREVPVSTWASLHSPSVGRSLLQV
jgi:hypothetical protein